MIKDALNFNKDTYYVGFDANQGAELQGQMVVDYIKANMRTRSIEMVTELSDMFLQSVISDTMIQSLVHVVFVQLSEQVLKQKNDIDSTPAGTNVDGTSKVVQDATLEVNGKTYTIRELGFSGNEERSRSYMGCSYSR